ncbi:MAG: S8 family peptidase [Bdellovibrionota bacterium]
MDRFLRIYSILFILIVIFVATGCSKQKTGELKVFQENPANCESTSHKTRYVVKKKDGSIVRVYAKSREEMLEKYVRPKLEELEIVESDQIIYANDLILGKGEITPNAQETWGAERIQASAAWNSGIKGQGVIVAVIDSGVELTHPSLSSKIYTNIAEQNGARNVDDDGNGLIDDIRGWDFAVESPTNHDTSGHGTHVAGVIAGSHTSGPMKGIAPDVKILPLDFMDGASGYTSDAIESINYAKKMGAKVINASWGSSFCSKILEDTINLLVLDNVLFVAAAGNNGNDISRYPEFPAAFQSSAQITVGAITKLGFMPSFSNWGQLVDVMAPGDEILSSYLHSDYAYLSGTSMAAPFVSGLAALLIGKNPNLTVGQLKSIILNSVTKRNYIVKTEGEINVPQALTVLNNL